MSKFFKTFNGTLYNNDCLKILKQKKDESFDLILTDPPYGINYYNNRRKEKGKIKTETGIFNDKDNNEFLFNVLKELFRILKDGRHIYWFTRYDKLGEHIELFKKTGFIVKNNLIWLKNNHGTGDLLYSYASKYECIIYAVKKLGKNTKIFKLKEIDGIKRHSDVLEFKKVNSNIRIHDHQKPIDLLSFLIKKSSNEGELILDPFSGSGSTFVAATLNNRLFEGIELDKDLYNISIKRYQNLLDERIDMTDELFEKYSKKELKVGTEFGKLINKKYIQKNDINKKVIDGKIDNCNIELQELSYLKSIVNKNLIIDVLSVFTFKNKKQKYITIENIKKEDIINIHKLGKIYTLSDNSIYLIYIDKTKLEDKKIIDKYMKYLQNDKYIFFPIRTKELKEYYHKHPKRIYVNQKEKNKVKDEWESAFTFFKIDEIEHLIMKTEKEVNEYINSFQYNNELFYNIN